MRFLIFAAALLSLSATVFAQTNQIFNTTISYDQTYDDGSLSTTGIACSNGMNGVIDQNHAMTLFDIPHWPNISGAPFIAGWNSVNCSSCWELQVTVPNFGTTVIHLLAIDVSSGGFNVGLNVMNNLTHGEAFDLGRVPATAQRVASTACEQGQSNKPPAPHASRAP
ncbi:Cerato-platanin-domain-containing protein [Ganoderma leucocontextum]|nr:Cerato-platanin-domain-containing protein [Ganoderma leucocontextum]